jgi:DNA polymerase-3 subunit epsilon
MSAKFENEGKRENMNQMLEVVRSGKFLVLDTETTGLGYGAEICQIAIIDGTGKVKLKALVRPVNPIPADATRIHGITNEHVADAFGWEIITQDVLRIIEGENVIIYNATFDRSMMHKSAEAAKLPHVDWKDLAKFYCAMLAYAEFWGEWSKYHQSYKWQTLSNACSQQQLPIKDAHTALGDCLATLLLVKKMAKVAAQKEA